MSSKTVSVDLNPVNLQWLEIQADASGNRSLSETLNRILDQARAVAGAGKAVRSVRGTISLPENDPDLKEADAAVRDIFRRSIERTAELLAEPDGADS